MKSGLSKKKQQLAKAELAHGRVCMLAVLGYTVQTSGAKWEPFITRYPTDSADPLKAATQAPASLRFFIFFIFFRGGGRHGYG